MKKYAILSIVVNVILLLIYFACFHQRKTLDDKNSIRKTLEMNNEVLIENQKRLIETALERLQVKPKLDTIISDEFCQNEICIRDFSSVVNKYIHKEISKDEMTEVFKLYESSLNQLNILFTKNLTRSQREAKLTDNEVEEKIKSFNLKINSDDRINEADLLNLSFDDNQLIIRTMENHLIQIQIQANINFCQLIGYRGCFVQYRLFPIAFDFKSDVKKGNAFYANIGIGNFLGPKYKNYCRVHLDGKEFDIFNLDDHKFHLTPTSIGNKKHELILSWVNPISKEFRTDTTHFEYAVTP